MNNQKELYNNILISGGTSMIPGFPTRLKNDMKFLFNERVRKGASGTSSIKIRVIDPPTRKYNVFIGASILAKATEDIPKSWVTKKEYHESGPRRMGMR
jgi:actin-related protein 2